MQTQHELPNVYLSTEQGELHCVTVSLALSHPWLWWVVGLAALVPTLAIVGWLWPSGGHTPTLLAVPTYGFFGMVAGLHAWIEAIGGNAAPTWEPTRRTPHSVDVSSH